MFGLVMQPILEHYQELITYNMIADYQYILNMPVSEMNDKYKLKMLCQGIREAFGLKKSPENFLWEQYLNQPMAYTGK